MNEKFEKFLNEFETQLSYYEFQKYILNENQVVYDIGHSAIYSVLVRQEDNRDHVIVEEIFNDNSQNFKVKKFTSKYVGVWVSYFPFYGQLGLDNQFKGKSQYEYIKEKLPELEIDKRYQEWKGYGTTFAGFELIDGDKKGYAIAKYSSIGSITELRTIGKELLNAYIDSKEREQKNSEYAYGESNFPFLLDKNMCNILENRYIKPFNIPKLSNGFKIFDLKGFWTTGYIKNKDEIPYSELEKLTQDNFQNTGVITDLYTENMQKDMPKLEDLDKEYIYAEVEYVDIDSDYMNYYYICDDTIEDGDKVLVNRAGTETIAQVISVDTFKGYEVPFPVARTKHIIKKIETEEELKKYGFSESDFEDYDDDDEDDEDDDDYHYFEYYLVMTYSDNKKVLEDISKELLEAHLVASSHISVVTSDFWWEGKIQSKEEYKLDVRTRSDKLTDVQNLIASKHNYQVPEISAIRLPYITDEMKKWIDESVEKENYNGYKY